jgi:SAM-dependent methyltransferase
MSQRFPFLSYPLVSFRQLAKTLPLDGKTKLRQHLEEADYSVRLLRYWWAGQALSVESKRLGRPLHVVDLGCERGWLKHFTPAGVVERWIGLDWNPQGEVTKLARYDEVHHANFDEPLPLPSGIADAVVSLHVFEHLPRPGATITEVSRLLKPGGIFLAGTPTMPDWLAQLRERYFRKQLREGSLPAGGHITVLSPKRWRALATDVGMETEFVTGSHAFRRTGSPLENQRWWIRLNQVWGALFPSLGSEAYIMARRSLPWVAQTDRLAPEDPHWRKTWIALATAAVITVTGLTAWFFNQTRQAARQEVIAWMDAQQKGSDHFIVSESHFRHLASERADTFFAESNQQLLDLLKEHPEAHVLVSLHAVVTLASSTQDSELWRIDSRLDRANHDYLLLKRSAQGTPLSEYLLGAVKPRSTEKAAQN